MNLTELQDLLAFTQALLAADREGVLQDHRLPSSIAVLSHTLLRALAKASDQDDVADLLLLASGKEGRRLLRQAIEGDLFAVLCTLEMNKPLYDACQKLLNYVTHKPEQRAALEMQMQIDVSSGTAQNVHQTQIQHVENYHPASRDTQKERQQQAFLTYLRRILSECNILALGQLDANDAEQRPMELSHVYIGLNTTAVLETESFQPRLINERSGRPITAIESFSMAPKRRLILLGPPGSGKSTFVTHLSFCLAGAELAAHTASNDDSQARWVAQLAGWTHGAAVPIRIVLRDFATFLSSTTSQRGSVRLVLEFLRTNFVEAGCIDGFPIVEDLIQTGGVVLLLDGLDEVVGETALTIVGECINGIVLSYPKCPILITCRTIDYEIEIKRHVNGFSVRVLAELTNKQINRFVTHWYRALADGGRRTVQQAAEHARALARALAARPDLMGLARNPLLLTVMALVHANKGRLPDSRTLLYYECIELLLLRWRQSKGEHDVLTRLGLSQFRGSDLLALMARLGFSAQSLSNRSPEEASHPAELRAAEVIQILADGFAPYDEENKYSLASILLRALNRGNGLLLQRGPDVYAFPHRTFQEFLAGYHLLGQRDYLKLCIDRAKLTYWHEVLLLMTGYQILASRDFEKPLVLAEKLLARAPHEQVLAGEILILIGRERAQEYDVALLTPGHIWEKAYLKLLELASSGSAIDASLRVRAGRSAGILSYGVLQASSQPQSAPLFSDKRIPFSVLNLPSQNDDWWLPAVGQYWCSIEASGFWVGDDTEVGMLRQEYMPYDYEIGRFPITNAEFARFIVDLGYSNSRWWSESGLRHIYQSKWRYPRYFDDQSFNNATQAVVGISWYEAQAYCAWLTQMGLDHGWLEKGDVIRLPTALEWQRAARHTDKRRYPWGDRSPTFEDANYQMNRIGSPSPIGCFPGGTAMCGAEDMVGNVWEWTATPYNAPSAPLPAHDMQPHHVVLLMGSAFYEEKERLACGVRRWDVPFSENHYVGFRVVLIHSSSVYPIDLGPTSVDER